MRIDTPLNDGAFRLQMGQKLAEALANSSNQEYQELAETMNASEEFLSDIQNAFSYLDRPAAFVLDNHDAVLDVGKVSIGMWGQLNELLEARDGHKKLRIFASSRAPLQDLARNEEERGSPYFSRLQVEPIEPFDLTDLDACLKPLEDSQIKLDESARHKLLRWTGGAPALVMRLLEAIEARNVRTWDAAQIDKLARSLEERLENTLGGQWHRAPIDVREAFVKLCQNKDDMGFDALPLELGREITRRGWMVEMENEGEMIPSHFVENYALRYGAKSSQLRGLFANQSDWEKQFPELIKLRLAQIENANPNIKASILTCVDCLLIEDNPRESLKEMRNIVGCALNLIWNAELGETPGPNQNRELPQHWLSRAQQSKIYGFPTDSGSQVPLLRALLMGFGRGEDRECLIHCITKPTYELINTLNGAGNFYTHPSGHATPFGFAAALCLSAVELCDALSRELPR